AECAGPVGHSAWHRSRSDGITREVDEGVALELRDHPGLCVPELWHVDGYGTARPALVRAQAEAAALHLGGPSDYGLPPRADNRSGLPGTERELQLSRNGWPPCTSPGCWIRGRAREHDFLPSWLAGRHGR